MDLKVKKSDQNYLRIELRIISDRINQLEISSLLHLDNLVQVLKGTHELIRYERSEILKVGGRLDGDDRWNVLDQALDWANHNQVGLKRAHVNADIQMDITTVCNFKRIKNPFPSEIKEKIRGIKIPTISIWNEVKKNPPIEK
jgi:hypothetical protein